MISIQALINNVGASIIFKVLAMAVGILILPAYVSYFADQNILGVWFAVLSILNWMIFFDFGLGNSLKNELICNLANRNFSKCKQLIVHSYFILIALSTLFFCLLAIIYQFFQPQFDNSAVLGSDYNLIVFTLAVTVLVQFPLRLVIAILFALQKSAVANLLPLVTQLGVMFYLFCFNTGDSNNKFLHLSIVFGLATCLPLILASVYTFRVTSGWDVKPRIGGGYLESLQLIVSGSKFFVIQVCLLFINGSNELLILKIFESKDVVQYQVYFRVFSLFIVIYSTLTLPIWSAIGQAKAIGQKERVLKLDRIMQATLIFLIFVMVLLCFYIPQVFSIWLGPGVVKENFLTSALFSAYIAIMMGVNYTSCIANGFNKINVQVKCLAFSVFIKLFAIYIFHDYLTVWTDIVLITIIALVPAFSLQFIFSRRILKYSLK